MEMRGLLYDSRTSSKALATSTQAEGLDSCTQFDVIAWGNLAKEVLDKR